MIIIYYFSSGRILTDTTFKLCFKSKYDSYSVVFVCYLKIYYCQAMRLCSTDC